ncbi:MAG: DUF4215 domain-containing protein [Myxococcota bacterium]
MHRPSSVLAPLSLLRPGSIAALLLLVPAAASAAVVPGQIVLQTGDMPPGAPSVVTNVRAPFVEVDGTVAFGGELLSGEQFVWRGEQLVWLDADEMAFMLGTAEVSVGTSPAGGFVYGPMVDGVDGLYTHLGVMTVAGQAVPDSPPGTLSVFHLRPMMAANGAVWWLAGVDDTGAGVTQGRVLLRSPNARVEDSEVILRSGDMVAGQILDSPLGLDNDFQISHNEQHLVVVLDLATGNPANDGAVYVDGALVAQEDDPNGDGDDWDSFDLVAIDNAGHYAFSGDTNGSTSTDEFVAYDGVIVAREGDLLDGVTLGTAASVRFLSLDDRGRMVHAWRHSGDVETMFLSCDPAQASTSTQAVLSTGDELDLDGDGSGDGIFVIDFQPTTGTPGRALGNDGTAYLEVEIDIGGMIEEAIIQVPVSCCGNGVVDPGEICDDGNLVGGDGCSVTCQGATCGDGVVDPGEDCDDGNAEPNDGCLPGCVAASCGDGVLWVGMEECDDADMDDTDICLSNCNLAICGDGVLWAGVEDCEDGNMDDTDDCVGACAPAVCGDGFVQAGVEPCDDGNADDTDACLGGCIPASCGDGFVWAGMEECDDANLDDTDMCLTNCVAATCGDGVVWDGVEMCDDGNRDDGDACPSTCAPATCGDGFVQQGVEDCDDGNKDDTDDCLTTCMTPFCGDGNVWDGVEECDDANDMDTDLCPGNCMFAFCGDGFVFEALEDCDDGNSDETDACLETCMEASCGDGFVWAGMEECDDGNSDDDDDCRNDCTLPVVVSDSSGGEDETGGDSTTGVVGSTGGGISSGGEGSGGEGSETGTGSGGGNDVVDEGCGCRRDGGGGGAVLGLWLLAWARRRRARVRSSRAS